VRGGVFLRKAEAGRRERAPVTVEGMVMSVTEKAVLVGEKVEGFGEWYPFSQIIDRDFDPDEIERGDEICFEIPRWLAREKGLAE